MKGLELMLRQSLISFLIALGVTLLAIFLIFPSSQGISVPPITMFAFFIVLYLFSFLVISRKKSIKSGSKPKRPKTGVPRKVKKKAQDKHNHEI